ncbi:MAG: 2-isopropylmalate synthase [Candidatus Firestonebacteria bacterium]
MLKFNKNSKTLEQDEYKYQLQNPEIPNLYRDIYSYGEVPKIPFNHRIVPMNTPEEIWMTDTTFRDGQQSLPPFTVKQIVDLYTMLHKLSGSNGMIKQCEFFLYTEKDRKAVDKCRERGYKFPEITGWIRAVKEDFKLVKDMGLKETGILTSVSDYHIFLKLKKSRKQAMDDYLGIVKSALSLGIIPRCHFEDITRADFYGFVVPFALELMKLSKLANIPVKIRACDTLGYGVTYPGVALPRSVKGLCYGLTELAGVPSEYLEWHGHNDFHKAVINASTAWLYGCGVANGSLLGIGERTGNTPLESLVIEFIELRGTTNGMDTTIIADITKYFEEEIGYKIPKNQPFVGANFNVTKAGIHADGIMKNEEIYNIFDTKKILKREVDVEITDKSGLSGITFWINSRLNLKGTSKIEKSHPAVKSIKLWIDTEYVSGRTTAISEQEMWAFVEEYLPDLLKKVEKVGKVKEVKK